MFQADADLRPGGGKRKSFRPLEDDNFLADKNVFHAECFEIVKFFDAIEIAVKNLLRGVLRAINMQQCESGTGDVFFGRSAESTYNSLGQRGFPAAEIAGKQDHQRRLQTTGEFPAPR